MSRFVSVRTVAWINVIVVFLCIFANLHFYDRSGKYFYKDFKLCWWPTDQKALSTAKVKQMYLKTICQTPMRIKCFNYIHFFLQSPSPPQGKVRKKRFIASWRKQKFLIRVVGEKFLRKHIANKQITKNKRVNQKTYFPLKIWRSTS